jgi:hypothetical protein
VAGRATAGRAAGRAAAAWACVVTLQDGSGVVGGGGGGDGGKGGGGGGVLAGRAAAAGACVAALQGGAGAREWGGGGGDGDGENGAGGLGGRGGAPPAAPDGIHVNDAPCELLERSEGGGGGGDVDGGLCRDPPNALDDNVDNKLLRGSGGATGAGGSADGAVAVLSAPPLDDDDAPSELLSPLLEEWPDLIGLVLAGLNTTDCAVLAQVGKPWHEAVVSRGLPRTEWEGAVPLKLPDFVGSVEMLAWARDNGCPLLDVRTCEACVGSHEAMQWTREHDCPWEALTCANAAFGRAEQVDPRLTPGCHQIDPGLTPG